MAPIDKQPLITGCLQIDVNICRVRRIRIFIDSIELSRFKSRLRGLVPRIPIDSYIGSVAAVFGQMLAIWFRMGDPRVLFWSSDTAGDIDCSPNPFTEVQQTVLHSGREITGTRYLFACANSAKN